MPSQNEVKLFVTELHLDVQSFTIGLVFLSTLIGENPTTAIALSIGNVATASRRPKQIIHFQLRREFSVEGLTLGEDIQFDMYHEFKGLEN